MFFDFVYVYIYINDIIIYLIIKVLKDYVSKKHIIYIDKYVHNSTNYIYTYKLRLSANRIYIYTKSFS